MTAKHSTQNSNPCPPVESHELSTGGLIGALILWGLFLVACDSSRTDVDTAVATPTRAQTKTAAERHFVFERFSHTGVNQRSTGHDSDLPGASIATYGN